MRSTTDGAPSVVYVPGLAMAGDELVIGGDEAHYLRRVVRVRPGESVTASDGEGTLAELAVLECAGDVRTEVRARRTVARAVALEVWCGAPEGDRADWLVEKLAELGVASLRLVDAERGRWERADRRAARWDRLTIAALRQSRSAFRMRIGAPEPLPGALATFHPGRAAYLADPAGTPFRPEPLATGAGACIAVGPSGGFSADELKSLEANDFVPTRLTPSRLRTETAALAMAALVLSTGG